MALNRNVKERKQDLKILVLVEYEGQVTPVMEARIRGGMKGKVHWMKAAEHWWKSGILGFLGTEHGVKGKEFGVMGKDQGLKGKEHGIKGKDHGIKGKEHGITGKDDGIKCMEYGVQGAQFGDVGGIFGQLCRKEVQQDGRENSKTMVAAARKSIVTPGTAINQVIKVIFFYVKLIQVRLG